MAAGKGNCFGGSAAVRGALLAAVVGLAALTFSPAASAESPRGGSAAVVVSPRQGQVVHGDDTLVRIRGTLRQARLNGVPIGVQLSSPRRGVRSLEASISQGLRRGRNVLRVATRRPGGAVRRTTVRFTVRPGGIMLGAGRDREGSVNGIVELRGKLLGGAGRADGSNAHWELVRSPRSNQPGEASAPAAITSPDGLTAGFDASAPGEYVVALEDGKHRDLVEINTLPRNLMVPIDTMATQNGEAGIQVGFRDNGMFLLRDAEQLGAGGATRLQVLVLERATLGFVRSVRFAKVGDLANYLSSVPKTDLVIVSLQPAKPTRQNFGESERAQLGKALESIGAPAYEPGELVPSLEYGGFSVIGVPGLAPGSADVNLVPEGANLEGPLRGYLSPDQHGNFGFVPKLQIPFSLPQAPSPPCATPSCPDKAGFRFRTLDGRTGKVLTDKFFATGVAATEREALTGLANALTGIDTGDLVEVEARSVALPQSDTYPQFQQLLPDPDMASVNLVARRLTYFGGTRNTFLRALAQEGSRPETTMPYALIGWAGAGEGKGVELGQDVHDREVPLRANGVLRPNLESLLKPTGVSAAPHRPDLADAVMTAPDDHWPMQGTPAEAAISFLGRTVPELGPDPRAAYWQQDELSPSDWRAIAKQIEDRDYSEVPRDRRDEIDRGNFEDGRDQLVAELLWVAKVTAYTEKLSAPFEKTVFKSWRETQKIGNEVADELTVSESDQHNIGVTIAQLSSSFLKMLGPITAGVSAGFAGAIDFGTQMYGALQNGQPTYQAVNSKAVSIGVKLSEEMEDASETFGAIRNVIVSDPKKLEYVGQNAFCSPSNSDCQPEFSYTSQDSKRIGVDLSRALQRTAYERLLPLKFGLYKLTATKVSSSLSAPPDPREYICPLDISERPFKEWTATQVRYAYTALLDEFTKGSPASGPTHYEPWYADEKTFQPYALAQWPPSYYAPAPSDRLLNRIFGPIPTPSDPDAYDNPNAGGLAVSLNAMLRGQDHVPFWRARSYENGRTACYWP